MSTMIETVAKAIARNVPIDGSRWNPGHGENFPVEFTDAEQKLIRSIAKIAVETIQGNCPQLFLPNAKAEDMNPVIAMVPTSNVFDFIDYAMQFDCTLSGDA